MNRARANGHAAPARTLRAPPRGAPARAVERRTQEFPAVGEALTMRVAPDSPESRAAWIEFVSDLLEGLRNGDEIEFSWRRTRR